MQFRAILLYLAITAVGVTFYFYEDSQYRHFSIGLNIPIIDNDDVTKYIQRSFQGNFALLRSQQVSSCYVLSLFSNKNDSALGKMNEEQIKKYVALKTLEAIKKYIFDLKLAASKNLTEESITGNPECHYELINAYKGRWKQIVYVLLFNTILTYLCMFAFKSSKTEDKHNNR